MSGLAGAMEWLVSAVERDLGVDRRQLSPGPRPQELVAFVSTRWVVGLRERRVTRCVRAESLSEAELRTFLQRSQVKLPPGWTRVCIHGLRKGKLGYRMTREPYTHGDAASNDSFMKTMQGVSQHNVRYETVSSPVHITDAATNNQLFDSNTFVHFPPRYSITAM